MIIMDGSRTKNKKIGGGDILRTKNDDGSSEGGRRREGVAATHFDGWHWLMMINNVAFLLLFIKAPALRSPASF